MNYNYQIYDKETTIWPKLLPTKAKTSVYLNCQYFLSEKLSKNLQSNSNPLKSKTKSVQGTDLFNRGALQLQQASFLKTHIISGSGNVDPGTEPVFLQHSQEVQHLGGVSTYKNSIT